MEVQLLRSGSFTPGMPGSTQVAVHSPVKCSHIGNQVNIITFITCRTETSILYRKLD